MAIVNSKLARQINFQATSVYSRHIAYAMTLKHDVMRYTINRDYLGVDWKLIITLNILYKFQFTLTPESAVQCGYKMFFPFKIINNKLSYNWFIWYFYATDHSRHCSFRSPKALKLWSDIFVSCLANSHYEDFSHAACDVIRDNIQNFKWQVCILLKP